ncbi:AAA family ATPase [Caryophanon latum]|uniref:Endonuclease GajA/Old nuclease/RecF-like AAA domain-containing protein n=1 Tax=Caryophanon latum TaxID=33977 RepID=A0A1C0YV61_9BACL|nr:AAA family ATPase [Caryophanon latum]OCS91057.1 hypothetical protein A6K76_09950 [Caryophanon latum]
MQLIYCYIEKYKALNNAGIHFDNRYECSVEKNGEQYELTINKAEDFDALQNVHDFVWGDSNISSISAIVGDNGAGKTTVLEVIGKYFRAYEDYSDEPFSIFICECTKSRNLKIFIQGNIQLEQISINSKMKCCIFDLKNKEINEEDQMTVAYVTNILDSKHYYGAALDSDRFIKRENSRNIGHIELSEGAVLADALEESIKEGKYLYNPIERYFSNEFVRQLQYLKSSKEKSLSLHSVEPKILWISIENSKHLMRRIEYNIEPTDKAMEYIDAINEVFKKLSNSSENSFIRNLMICFIQEVRLKSRLQFELYAEEKSLNFFRTVTEDKKNLYANPIEVFERFFKICRESKFDEVLEIQPYVDVIESFKRNKKILFESEFPWLIPINLDKNTNKEALLDFYECIEKVPLFIYDKFISFEWAGISSGEYALFNLFSKLYRVSEMINGRYNLAKYTRNPKSCLILLDECEITLHPQWQTQVIDKITEFFKEMIDDPNMKIQIILTTHSPILLSDMHQSNVVYMRQEETLEKSSNKDEQQQEKQIKLVIESGRTHKQTFAQNIHELFTDAFFLKHTRGTLAENTLDKINQQLENMEKNGMNEIANSTTLRQLADVIDHIGEPVLRNFYKDRLLKLHKQWESKKLETAKEVYAQLSNEEKRLFIEHLLQEADED